MQDYLLIIPSRYKSSRFPGKPLKIINGKTLLQRVYDQCVKAVLKEKIYIATDDHRISNYCKFNNINFIMTSTKCKTGTDRIFEISKKIKAKIYINVQGDEPLIEVSNLKKFVNKALQNKESIMIAKSRINKKNFYNYNIPKIVTNDNDELIYISRSGIPATKSNKFFKGYGQVNLYSYPIKIFKNKKLYNKKSSIEKVEDIEILRFLEKGFRIKVLSLKSNNHPVDVPHDIKIVEKILKRKKWK